MNTKLVFGVIAATALASASVCYGAGVVDGATNSNHVPGESLDSGLGDLPSTYAASEYLNHVPGEKLDSGLGDLAWDYDAREYTPSGVAHVTPDGREGQLSHAGMTNYVPPQ